MTVALNDPAASNSWFPPCIFHRVTGLWCPGCGLTRGAHALFNGRLGESFGYNIFTPLALLAIVMAWWTWTSTSFGRPLRNPVERLPDWFTRSLGIAVFAYGILRNIPFEPLRALAP